MADNLLNDRNFILAAARCGEGLISEAELRKEYRHFDADVWERLGRDDKLIAAIQAMKVSRVRSGALARERAQVLYAEVPNRLAEFLKDPNISPRFAIESAKEIRAIADRSPETAAAAAPERFLIQINLGHGEILTYPNDRGDGRNRKNASPKVIDANRDDDIDPSDEAQELLPFIVNANKGNDGNGGVL